MNPDWLNDESSRVNGAHLRRRPVKAGLGLVALLCLLRCFATSNFFCWSWPFIC